MTHPQQRETHQSLKWQALVPAICCLDMASGKAAADVSGAIIEW